MGNQRVGLRRLDWQGFTGIAPLGQQIKEPRAGWARLFLFDLIGSGFAMEYQLSPQVAGIGGNAQHHNVQAEV